MEHQLQQQQDQRIKEQRLLEEAIIISPSDLLLPVEKRTFVDPMNTFVEVPKDAKLTHEVDNTLQKRKLMQQTKALGIQEEEKHQ